MGMQCSATRLVFTALGVAALCTVVGVSVYFGTREDGEAEEPTLEQCIPIVKESPECIYIPACNATDPWPTASPKPPNSDYLRLPTSLKPLHYNIELRPHFYSSNVTDFLLEGNVTITLEVVEATDVITVHTRSLVMRREDIGVWYDDGAEVEVTGVEADLELEFFKIRLGEEVEVGRTIRVWISYTAPLTNDDVGIYYSRYYQDGDLKYMLGTQFEPLDARKAFPCLDEPALKAYFNVTLWKKLPMVALTNMPNYTSEESGDWVIEKFEQTPIPMPTYLLAFAWAEFEYLEKIASSGLKDKNVRVWSAPDAKETGQLDYANEVAGQMFDQLENLYGIPFDLEELDKIPIREYKFGAMENWGLVTYDDTRLLVHPNYTSYYDRQRLTRTMSHELVHMWFGNQVTCAWWDDVWLHETFARFFEYYGVNGSATPINVDWEHIYIVQTFISAYRLDEAGQANPIHAETTSIADIESVLSSIIYDKGSAIVRMMKQFVFENETTFLDAQRQYLNDNMHSNTLYDDLIEAWLMHTDPALPVDFTRMLESWILQTGHPVITLTRSETDPEQFSLTQKMFLVDPDRPIKEMYPPPFDYKWVVPFAYVTQNDPITSNMQKEWLDLANGDITAGGLGADDWILGNPGLYGFYRVNYDDDNWRLLQQQLIDNHQVIDVRNRGQLLYDSVIMSQSGIVAAELPVNLSKYLGAEEQYVPWFTADIMFSKLNNILANTDFYESFRVHVRTLVNDTYTDLGWDDEGDDEDHEIKYLRTLILELSCTYQTTACIEMASEKFDEWVYEGKRSRSEIDPAQRALIGCVRLRERAGPGDWDALYAVYQEVRDFHKIERARVRDGLACTRDAWLLNRYAQWAVSRAEELHEDDYTSVLSAIARNQAGRELIWTILDTQWTDVPGRTSVLSTVTDYFNTQYDLQRLDEFYDRHPPSSASETSTYETIQYKVKAAIKWRDRLIAANPTFITNSI